LIRHAKYGGKVTYSNILFHASGVIPLNGGLFGSAVSEAALPELRQREKQWTITCAAWHFRGRSGRASGRCGDELRGGIPDRRARMALSGWDADNARDGGRFICARRIL